VAPPAPAPPPKPAPAPPPAPAAPGPQPAVAGASPTAALEEADKRHKDARRFARLLVSEIKLYNENAVSEGRNRSDLYQRLKKDIDRSHDSYNQRIGEDVRAQFDYLYDELVRQLCEGDPTKLGPGAPEPNPRGLVVS
jgi:hypothetical protein